MKQRLLMTALVMALALVVSACGNDPTPTPTSAPPTATPTTGPAPTATATPVPGAPAPTATPTATPSAAVDFSGKTISVVVMYSPGGGYDAIGRVVSRFLGQYLPGNPRMVVQNRPGAGGVIGSNYAYSAKPDGLTLAEFPTDVVLNQIVGAAGVEYDFQKFNYIGALEKATKACFFRSDKNINSIDDLVNRSDNVFVGGSGGGGDTIFSALMVEELGAKITHVLGYQGTADTHIAIESGEVDGRCTTWSTVPASNPAWFETDPPLVKPVLQFTIGGPDAALPGVTTAEDLKAQFSELGWASLSAAMLPLQTYRTFALPPGADVAVIEAYRAAFEQMYSSDEFIQAMAQANRPLQAQSGAEVEHLLVEEIQITPEVVANLIRLLAIQ